MDVSEKLTQGAVSAGEFPTNLSEMAFFVEAFYTREAILAIPEEIDEEELRVYKKVIIDHIVSL